MDRRAFLLRTAAMAATASIARGVRAEVEGDLAHPIDPPKALEFRVLNFPRTPMYGGPSTAIAAIPKGLAPGEKLPLVVLMPGGHHNMQGHEHGTWGWWSEYRLGDIDTALRRGVLEKKDFYDFVRPNELEEFNRLLSVTPYRGAVLVTPWVLGRQLQPEPHGNMIAAFLRELVAKVREELPVIPTREASGLGGMSSGGLQTIFAGSVCSDLFATLVATQPFTEDLVPPLRKIVNARLHNGMPQRIRMVTSTDDHQKKTTVALFEALRSDGVAIELKEYPGAHSAQFAAGPGGIDALFTFDRALRGEAEDGTRPLPSHDGLLAPIESADDPPRHAQAAPLPSPYTRGEAIATWGAVAATGLGISLVIAKNRRESPKK